LNTLNNQAQENEHLSMETIQSSKLICDTCHHIIGEQRFEYVCSRKTFRNPAQYSIYKIYPYLRRLTLEEIYNLK